jgi:hypothetical protein
MWPQISHGIGPIGPPEKPVIVLRKFFGAWVVQPL